MVHAIYILFPFYLIYLLLCFFTLSPVMRDLMPLGYLLLIRSKLYLNKMNISKKFSKVETYTEKITKTDNHKGLVTICDLRDENCEERN
jgi:hypothetical protein